MISKYETHLRVAKHYCGVATAIGELFAKGGEEVVRSLAFFDQERGQIDAALAWLHSQTDATQQVNTELDELLVDFAAAMRHTGHLRYDMRSQRIPQMEKALE